MVYKSRIDTNKDSELIYPKLSYKIMGILFEIHNKLSTEYQEKHYQCAVETKLRASGFAYKREEEVIVKFEGES